MMNNSLGSFVQQSGGYYGYRMMDGGFAAVLGIFAIILMVALTVLTVVLTIRLIKTGRSCPPISPHAGPHAAPAAPPDPLRILDERYARGEISAEDYGRMKQNILSRGPQ